MAANIPSIAVVTGNQGQHDRNLKDRYWKFLFDNLQRAVDELYATCENDENILQCKEVAMILERCSKDFYALIERFKLLQSFDFSSDKKPTSLAWEVRPSVPIPKCQPSEMSPRRSAGRLSKRTLFTVSCIPSNSGSVPHMTTTESDQRPMSTPPLCGEKYISAACEPLAISIGDYPEKVASTKCDPGALNNENKVHVDSGDGEWRLVKPHKKGRVFRKNDSSYLPNATMPSSSSTVLMLASSGSGNAKANDNVQKRQNDADITVSESLPEQNIMRSRASTLSNDHRKRVSSFSFNQAGNDSDLDMDMSIELDEALISALTAEDELNNELREELREDDSIGGVDDPDYTDDQSDSWLSASVDSIRIPGRSVELHEKLLSPARRSKNDKVLGDDNGRVSLAEQLAEKQMKVMELRERRQQDKIERCALLSKRVEEVRAWKNELLHEKKRAIESKMQAAEQRRLSQLQQIVRKAHDEETKGSEIAFINNIEAESRKQEVQAKYQLWRKRLLELADEQNKRREVTAARNSAASDRKKALDAERQNRMQELLVKQKERERKAEERQVEKYQERVAISRAREREHEERMAQLRMADEERKQELRERIYHKQQNVQARHSELIEQRRERAVALSMQSANTQSPRQQPSKSGGGSGGSVGASGAPLLIDVRKFCTVCSTILDSDIALLDHIKSRQHRQQCAVPKNSEPFCMSSMQAIVPLSVTQQQQLSASMNLGQDQKLNIGNQVEMHSANNRQLQKKRAKKYRQRLNAPAEKDQPGVTPVYPDSGRLTNIVADLDRVVDSLTSNQALADHMLTIERLLCELVRTVEKPNPKDRVDFCHKFASISGFSVLAKILTKYSQLQTPLNANTETVQQSSKKSAITENSDRLISFVLQCLLNTFKLNLDCCVFILFAESEMVAKIFDMLAHGMEALAQTAVNSLRLNGHFFDAAQVRVVTIASWVVAFMDGLTVRLVAGNCDLVNNRKKEAFRRCLESINLLLALGLVERTTQVVAVATYLTEFDDSVCSLLKALSSLLAALCRLSNAFKCDWEALDKADDSIWFVAAIHFTDLAGIVSLVYALLLKDTGFGKSSGEPHLLPTQRQTDIPKHAAELALEAFKFLTSAGVLNSVVLQTTLGSDSSLMLQFRQACAYLLSQANANQLPRCHQELIDQVIMCVGLFSLGNQPAAESFLLSGQPPAILQQLCQLPIQYFTDPNMSAILMPTLLATTYNSPSCLAVLKGEMSPHLILKSLKDQVGRPVTFMAGDISVPSFSCRFPQRYWQEAIEWFSRIDLAM